MKTPSRSPPASSGWREVPCSKLADFFGQASGEGKQAGKGQILAEGNEMDFVVAGSPFAAGADQCRGVEQAGSLATFAGRRATFRSIRLRSRLLCHEPSCSTASRNRGSLVKKGAGDSGQTIKSILALGAGGG